MIDEINFAINTWIKKDRNAWIYFFSFAFCLAFYFSAFFNLSAVSTISYFFNMYIILLFSYYIDDSFKYLSKDIQKEKSGYEKNS